MVEDVLELLPFVLRFGRVYELLCRVFFFSSRTFSVEDFFGEAYLRVSVSVVAWAAWWAS